MSRSYGSHKRLAAVVLAGFCSFLQLYVTQPLLPLLRREFDASELMVSLTLTAGGLGVAFGAPWAGSLADRFGRRRVIVWSAFLLGVTGLLTATAVSLPQLLAWRFAQGLVTPGVFTATTTYITEEFRDTGVGRAVSAYISGTVFGGFSSRIVSGLVADALGWQGAFVVLAAVTLAGASALWAWLPRERARALGTESAPWWISTRGHLRNPQLLAAYSVGFCLLFTMVGTFTYITFHLAETPFLLSSAEIGLIFFVYLAGAVVTPVAGRAIDRAGSRTIVAAAVSTAVLGMGFTLASRLWIVAFGLAVVASGVFVAQAATSSYIGAVAEENRGLALGLYSLFYYLGGSAGAAVPGFFWTLGGWPACAAFIACVQVLTVTIVIRAWRNAPAPVATMKADAQIPSA